MKRVVFHLMIHESASIPYTYCYNTAHEIKTLVPKMLKMSPKTGWYNICYHQQ